MVTNSDPDDIFGGDHIKYQGSLTSLSIHLSGLTAYDVCTHLPGNHDCSRFAYLVADVVTVIAEGVAHRKDLPLYGNEKAKDELKSRRLFQRNSRFSVPSRSADGTLKRRGSGYDFLVSYKAYKYDMSIQPNENGIEAVADAIGKDWASRMTNHKDWANYITAAPFGSQWRINFDVIPESGDNWSENAQSQNVCGNAEYNF
ncbi:hypothetical protein F5Y00DRAFT_257606 [Daldinia vernicosa]|uniref:uncharacterized protein n=1 Tax=Daldinia vernicosa TaxID=114800 RepID=UPI002007C24B|nr:uncharacterized protein F5Y00DRAFT_257606 [Daldinia vernicosa]KAI0853586.1 hypothetical protein F5Y00DRAFT_257606 [Daldinia vernicosa]